MPPLPVFRNALSASLSTPVITVAPSTYFALPHIAVSTQSFPTIYTPTPATLVVTIPNIHPASSKVEVVHGDGLEFTRIGSHTSYTKSLKVSPPSIRGLHGAETFDTLHTRDLPVTDGSTSREQMPRRRRGEEGSRTAEEDDLAETGGSEIEIEGEDSLIPLSQGALHMVRNRISQFKRWWGAESCGQSFAGERELWGTCNGVPSE